MGQEGQLQLAWHGYQGTASRVQLRLLGGTKRLCSAHRNLCPVSRWSHAASPANGSVRKHPQEVLPAEARCREKLGGGGQAGTPEAWGKEDPENLESQQRVREQQPPPQLPGSLYSALWLSQRCGESALSLGFLPCTPFLRYSGRQRERGPKAGAGQHENASSFDAKSVSRGSER